MKMNIKGFWWKVTGVAIFLYVLIGGLTIPLRPGVSNSMPGSAGNGDSVVLHVTGYNTHFRSASENRAWLKYDSMHLIEAVNIHPITENDIDLVFQIPVLFPSKEKVNPLTVVFDNEIDGAFIHPNALFITVRDSIQNVDTGWNNKGIKNLHEPEGLRFPYRNILNETIRNTFFHVALWFAMFVLLIGGLYHAIQYLRTGHFDHDIQSAAYNRIAIMFGVFGLVTGSIWAKFTWNTYWTTDVKLNMTAVALLIYLAYLVLRGASSDQDKRAKLSASYSIFAFLALIPLVFVIPRLTDSLHPGNGGNPALGGEDLDHTLRLFFYPSVLALILLGNWMAVLLIRYERIKEKIFLNS